MKSHILSETSPLPITTGLLLTILGLVAMASFYVITSNIKFDNRFDIQGGQISELQTIYKKLQDNFDQLRKDNDYMKFLLIQVAKKQNVNITNPNDPDAIKNLNSSFYLPL